MKRNSLLNIMEVKKLLVLAVFLLLGINSWAQQEPDDKVETVTIEGPSDYLKMDLIENQEITEYGTETGAIQIQASEGWTNEAYTYLVYKNDVLIADLSSNSAYEREFY